MTKDTNQQNLQFGLIAEEAADIIPELVLFKAIDETEGSPVIPETIFYQHLAPMLLGICKKQAVDISTLQSDVAIQRAETQHLRAELAELRELVLRNSP